MKFLKKEEIGQKYFLGKRYFLLKDNHNLKYRLFDGGKVTPFNFKCKTCKKTEIKIGHKTYFSSSHLKEIINEVDTHPLKNMGICFDILHCSHCDSHFYIGLGYMEPNNGRDVYMVHTIIGLDEDVSAQGDSDQETFK